MLAFQSAKLCKRWLVFVGCRVLPVLCSQPSDMRTEQFPLEEREEMVGATVHVGEDIGEVVLKLLI